MPFVEQVESAGIRGFLHRPEASNGEGIVLTHSAGSNCRAPLLIAVADAFCNSGFTVLRYDLPFRQVRPTGPPLRTADKDQQGIADAVKWTRQQVTGRVFAGGHSYGGRMTIMLAAAQPELADGLLLLSYPLHPPKSPSQLRTAHFPNLRTPALFVHGTRDGFGSIDEVVAAIKLIPARTQVLPIDSGGHELLTKKNASGLPAEMLKAFVEFFR